MQRQLLSALLLVLLGSSAAMAEDWARKMFAESSHDFGTVARDAKVEYRFQFTNPYQETAHVVAVSSSCGCTTPEVTKSELKTYDKSEIVAKFNTRSFTGNHSATVTVTFDKPFYAQVQLNVWGDIRGELQLQPEQVELGTIDQGQEVERRVTVTHYGSSDWKVLDVRSVNTNYEVEVKDGPRSFDKVTYDLVVRLKKDAPPGYLKDQLILVTNDPRVTQFPVEVEGLVKAELSASPQSLALGLVEVGKTATKPIVVRGRRPFMVTAVRCDDDAFTFKVPTAASAVQFIPVTFTAPDKAGKIAKKIRIETDLGKSFVVEVIAQAEVKATEHPADIAPGKTDTAADKTAAVKPDSDKKAGADKAGADKPTSEKAGVDPKASSPNVQPATASRADTGHANPVRASSASAKSGI
ncbi:MAG TPA: DUF1573 domain-containing protein [Pirellulales bacterium]|nr:DUF1573 domain-containing protein [Pirellulales bacterium]